MFIHLLHFYSHFLGEVLFNFNYPTDPPDFIFPTDVENFQPEVEEIKVSKLLVNDVAVLCGITIYSSVCLESCGCRLDKRCNKYAYLCYFTAVKPILMLIRPQ